MILLPSAIAIIIWLVLNASYDLLGVIDDIRLYRNLASINWILLVVCIGFSSLVIYPIAWFKGVSFRLRLLAVYVLPLVWCIKEFIRVSENVTAAEALFYIFFTSIQLLLLIGQVGLIGICEITCRAIYSRKNPGLRVINPGSVIAILATMVFLYFAMIRGGGYDFALMIKMIYRGLFL